MSSAENPIGQAGGTPDFIAASALLRSRPKPQEHGSPHSDTFRENPLRREAFRQAQTWKLCSGSRVSRRLTEIEKKWRAAARPIESALRDLSKLAPEEGALGDAAEWFLDHSSPLRTVIRETREAVKHAQRLPHVASNTAGFQPRAYAAAASYLRATGYVFSEEEFSVYMDAAQCSQAFQMRELWALKPMMQLILLQQLAASVPRFENKRPSLLRRGEALRGLEKDGQTGEVEVSILMLSLKQISEADWSELFEALSETEKILRQDPAGAYCLMDAESREQYRRAVLQLAEGSECTEAEIARKALAIAGQAEFHAQLTQRARYKQSHVGYYLLDKGKAILRAAIDYRAPLRLRLREAVLARPQWFYFTGIGLGLACILALVAGIAGAHPLGLLWFALLLFPAAEAAISLMIQLAAVVAPAKSLCKLDYSKGVPPNCTTMVVVPTLLINEEQVRKAARDLEIRYLANRDRNLHFALLTDPPDSAKPCDEKEALSHLCAALIAALNEKYTRQGKGSFFLFHRQRVYNQREGKWMGWERKRGKLLDFNNLLRGKWDRFPIKVGDLSILPKVKYVITLDADTQLPRQAAQKLIGTIAHPLNSATVDPKTNTVTEGYTILQPRVAVSIQSASRSRLAAILSGRSGFDIYTRAVSDVYQDLFGEGNFVGKGIYEVETFQQVLDERFPCNALLSHDLIEGLYARAGLVTDVEVVEDYPSNYNACARRKHRWLRGDWQILPWLFPRVPDYFGQKVANPLSFVSRWKIFDNLRRSVTDIALLLLLAFCFFVPTAAFWTCIALLLVLVPAILPLSISIARAGRVCYRLGFWRELGAECLDILANVFLRFAFVLHQTLLSLDAIIRTMSRMVFTRSRLLEWETATEAELAVIKRTPVEALLQWCPWISLGLAVVVAFRDPAALVVAAPFLLLWAGIKPLSQWLNRPAHKARPRITTEDEGLLRSTALRTWSFFRQFSTEKTHWLVPDTVQEAPAAIAHRISPTNLGFLLNSTLAACDLGYLTAPEFATGTQRIFTTIEQLPRFRGHFFNWYDICSLSAVEPLFISTVDSGNLACCLWTLKNGCAQMTREPLFGARLWRGLVDHLNGIEELLSEKTVRPDGPRDAVEETKMLRAIRNLKRRVQSLAEHPSAAMNSLSSLEQELLALQKAFPGNSDTEMQRWMSELVGRMSALSSMMREFAPWLTPFYRQLCSRFEINPTAGIGELTLANAPQVLADLECQLTLLLGQDTSAELRPGLVWLRALVRKAGRRAAHLLEIFAELETRAASLVEEMDFNFLYDRRKKLLSIGFDVASQQLSSSNYGLLASEARAAAFIAIAKGDIPQESWFHLGRAHARWQGQWALKSWTGTMFEYLLPSIWMSCYPKTLLDQSARAAVRCQQKFGRRKRVPWGISEAAYSRTDQEGNYQYRAFGLPALASNRKASSEVVVSPYASFLALSVDMPGALENLRNMKQRGWLGRFGFYEAADFHPERVTNGNGHELVRCWMAHHQGMTLLASSDVLAGGFRMQQRFHAEAAVAATERLLHERIPYRSLSHTRETRDAQRFSSCTRDDQLILRLRYGLRSLASNPMTPAALPHADD